jgi:hypothetical protein
MGFSNMGRVGARVSLLLLASIAASSPEAIAETWQPRVLDCSTYGLAVAAGQRIALQGFSVVLPSDANWCVQSQDEKSLVLTRTPLTGKMLMERPSASEIKHGIVLHASLASTLDGPVRTLDELRRVAQTMASAAEGFAVRNSALTPTKRSGADCIGIATHVEDLNNPLSPSGGFNLLIEDLVCLHPGLLDVVVVIGYSERYPSGYEPRPLLAEALRPQLDAFVGSLTFLPNR